MLKVLYAIFLVAATLLALATLVYVIVDLVKKDPVPQAAEDGAKEKRHSRKH